MIAVAIAITAVTVIEMSDNQLIVCVPPFCSDDCLNTMGYQINQLVHVSLWNHLPCCRSVLLNQLLCSCNRHSMQQWLQIPKVLLQGKPVVLN